MNKEFSLSSLLKAAKITIQIETLLQMVLFYQDQNDRLLT